MLPSNQLIFPPAALRRVHLAVLSGLGLSESLKIWDSMDVQQVEYKESIYPGMGLGRGNRKVSYQHKI